MRRSSSASSSPPSSPRTSMSSTRFGRGPEAPGGGRHDHDSPDGLTPRQLYRIDRRRASWPASTPAVRGRIRPALAAAGIPIVRWNELDDAGAGHDARDVQRPDLSGAHSPGGRPGASVPAHLQPVAEPRGPGPRPGQSAAPRADQGSAPPAAIHVRRGQWSRPGVGAAGGRHRRQPGQPVPRHGHCRVMVVPGHPSFRISRSTTTKPKTCWRRSRKSCGERFSRAVRLEVEEGMPDHVIALLTRSSRSLG